MKRNALLAAAMIALTPLSAGAQEVFTGVYAHEIETPLTFAVEEGGADIELGYRFAPEDALEFIGSPQPYVLASVNTAGDTSFVGGGLAWRFDTGGIFIRPGVGVVVHDGPDLRVSPTTFQRTDLGSRVVFEPELGIGTRLTDRLDVEASWVHISHARLFNAQQNPGIDMWGVRLTWRTR